MRLPVAEKRGNGKIRDGAGMKYTFPFARGGGLWIATSATLLVRLGDKNGNELSLPALVAKSKTNP